MANEVLYETQESIVVITINRPERRNAISMAVREQLHNAFLRFESDPALRVAILTGAGDQAFCAGMDLKEAADLKMQVTPYMPTLGENLRVTKPVIAAVNGHAYAGGWLMAQMCDLCIAADTARFGITEAKLGRGFPWAVPLLHMIPQRVVLELLMTAGSISAQRGYEIGFVNRVVSAKELMPRAMDFAREITANAPLTVAAAKEMVYLGTDMSRTAALKYARQLFDDKVYRSEDALEGPRAFKEKRKPTWKGR
ncbi:MAG: enoyl-CoA hydratase/isomerase family protein [Betaproteobacteria bacterium]|nr:enoyl-CoA hydratase/isomerase family protein [Betaproteobacteria bacterium]